MTQIKQGLRGYLLGVDRALRPCEIVKWSNDDMYHGQTMIWVKLGTEPNHYYGPYNAKNFRRERQDFLRATEIGERVIEMLVELDEPSRQEAMGIVHSAFCKHCYGPAYPYSSLNPNFKAQCTCKRDD
jgi:hypothetical protein